VSTARRLQVFATEPEAVQLSWARLVPGAVVARATEDTSGEVVAEAIVESTGGPGTADLTGLAPDTAYTVTVGAERLRAHTPAPPPGAELYRFMTMSDMHLGQADFGLFLKMREKAPTELHTLRGTRAALAEGRAWGAQHLVLKGDLVDRAAHDEYDLLGKVLAEAGLPTEAVPGNHEVKPYRQVDYEVAFASLGLAPLDDGLRTVDLPGLRVVLIDSTVVGEHYARADHVLPRLAEAIDGRPAFVVLHHHLLPLPLQTWWPPGMTSPGARRLVEAVKAASPVAIITSGHTHRHRTRRDGHVLVCETGSPKDHPGTWTGYVVHEGGIRQVVRRVGRPDVIEWTERTRRAAGGVWGHWSPGTLDQRCWNLDWPT
jgi:3',5'-cyclic AMP phosphodiesterase CpdA